MYVQIQWSLTSATFHVSRI